MTPSNNSIELKLLEVREQIQKHLNSSVLETSLFNPLISPGPASITLLQCDIPSNNNNQHFKIKEYTHINSKYNAQNGEISPSNSVKGSNSLSSTSSNISNPFIGHTNSTMSSSQSSNVTENYKYNTRHYIKNCSNNNSRKGLVAAAALTVAVTNPFPSMPKQSTVSKNHATLHDSKVPKSYVLPRQTNILTCKCGANGNIIDMNGVYKPLLIQCSHCNRWQHMKCYGLTNKLEILPIKFYCNVCQPGLTMSNYKISKKIIDKKRKVKNIVNNSNNTVGGGITINGTVVAARESDFTNTVSQTELDVATQLTKIRGDVPYLCRRESSPIQKGTVQLSPLLHNSVTLKSRSSSIDSDVSNRSSESGRDVSASLASVQRIKSIYKDKYVRDFVCDHNNDDWVVQMNKRLSLPLEKDIIYSCVIQNPQGTDSNQIIKGVFAKRDINKGDMISEVIGEIDFQRNYTVDPVNQYRILGTTQPKVFFHPHWPIYVDTRNSKSIYKDADSILAINELRRSCRPNVELKTIRTPLDSKDDCGIHFVVVATRDIKKDEELLIKWQWDLRHPVCQIIDGHQVLDNLGDMDKYWLIHCIDTIWQISPCACQWNQHKDTCLLIKIKEYANQFHQILKTQANRQAIGRLHK